jgi:hypothetical protein
VTLRVRATNAWRAACKLSDVIKRALTSQLSGVALTGALLVAGCGRFGVELLPKPVRENEGGAIDEDGSVQPLDDSGNPVTGACDGGSCADACSECGCGVAATDGDGDGTPDCVDECPADANKARAGQCGCAVSEQDTDLDGVPDCIDRCSGNGAPYSVDDSCGVGHCRENNVASTCMSGVETMCMPGAPLSTSDTTCNNVDDDCDGQVDDDYVGSVRCGVGACNVAGTKTCVNGEELESCTPGAQTGTDNDCDDIDDDCDGTADEHYVGAVRSCGTGSCTAMAQDQCVDGAVVQSCVPTGGMANDTSCNNIDEDCDGSVDEDYVVTATNCGVGACARTGSRSCMNGRVVDSCVAGTAATSDTTCNNVDDDCNGQRDEDYVVTGTNCGTGYCAATGQRTCMGGAVSDSCTPRAPRTSTDDAFAPGNGVDDDCDGRVDEDVPACNTTPITFEAGQYTVAVPGNCKSLTVRLWGGGGASGENKGLNGNGGDGASGGYASATSLVSGTINLYVGTGAASGCNNAGTNAGSASYNGGSGGSGTGANGADGVVSGGGTGASPNQGSAGGRGYYGGGGGGQGNGGLGEHGNGGGGGAASVLLVNGTRVAVAGGGGGGGGADSLTFLGTITASGGEGGPGCSGNGGSPASQSGGGGGGGVCQGSTVTRGSGVTPANSGSIPNGRARGGSGSCQAGGNGYATITFTP